MIYCCLEEQKSIIYGKKMTKNKKKKNKNRMFHSKRIKKSWPVKPNQC